MSAERLAVGILVRCTRWRKWRGNLGERFTPSACRPANARRLLGRYPGTIPPVGPDTKWISRVV